MEVLRHAASDGQLTVEELEGRVSGAYAAKTRRELEQPTADVTPAPAIRSPGQGSGLEAERRQLREAERRRELER